MPRDGRARQVPISSARRHSLCQPEGIGTVLPRGATDALRPTLLKAISCAAAAWRRARTRCGTEAAQGHVESDLCSSRVSFRCVGRCVCREDRRVDPERPRGPGGIFPDYRGATFLAATQSRADCTRGIDPIFRGRGPRSGPKSCKLETPGYRHSQTDVMMARSEP